MYHKLKKVTPLPGFYLLAEFQDGALKQYNVNPLFARFEVFNQLKQNNLFKHCQIDTGGYGVCWNDAIDLSADEIWQNGVAYKSPFNGLISFTDATKLWGLNESTLRKSVSYGKLIEDVDCKKFGNQWLVTIDSMRRQYGEPKAPIL